MLETIADIFLYGFAFLGVFWSLILSVVGYYLHKDRTWDELDNKEAIMESQLLNKTDREIYDEEN